jgi:ubiquinone biosynthesis protein
MKLTSSHLRRYKDLALLFLRHGRGDLARHVRQLHADFPSPEPVADDPTDATPCSTDDGPERLAADLERMGPTYIKLGQVLAGRPDILPPAYQAALARLQDKSPAKGVGSPAKGVGALFIDFPCVPAGPRPPQPARSFAC